MKVVILAGGLGTRISEETSTRPKPMVEIGGRPILWHIMKIYSRYGFNDFVICLGYKGYMIKEYFANYFLHMSDVTFHLAENRMEVHRETAEPWRVTLVDTGENTQTGGRLKRVLPYVANEPFFALTYGDGVADIDLGAEIAFHKAHGRRATVSVVRPAKRFGAVAIEGATAVADGCIAEAERHLRVRGQVDRPEDQHDVAPVGRAVVRVRAARSPRVRAPGARPPAGCGRTRGTRTTAARADTPAAASRA